MTNTNETHNGYSNRETWALMLHIGNDEGMYETTKGIRTKENAELVTDYEFGQDVVEFWRDFLDTYTEEFGVPLPEGLLMFDREVGSWWRIDYAEVGAAVREMLED